MAAETTKVKWTKEELDFLIANFGRMTIKEIQKNLPGKSTGTIYGQAQKFGLTKTDKKRFRKETKYMADIICFYVRRGESMKTIVRDLHCPEAQVNCIIKRCMADGSYDRFAKEENKALMSENYNIPLFNNRGRKNRESNKKTMGAWHI